MKLLAKFFIERPLAANILSLFFIIAGLVSFSSLKRQATPLIHMGEIRIFSALPAASPEDIELKITNKIEDALETVSGLKNYKSTSSEGLSTIEVFIDPDAPDQKDVRDEVRRAVESVTGLPEDMPDKPLIQEIRVDDMIVYDLAIVFDTPSPGKLQKVSRELKKRLKEIPEISQVKENNVPEREIKILLDANKLHKFQVSIDEVIQTIQSNSIRLSAGSIERNSHEKTILTVSEFENPQDVGNLVLRSTARNQRIYIRDIAKIIDGFKKQDRIVRVNGHHASSLLIKKKASADLIDMVEKIEAVKRDYLRKNPDKGLSLVPTWDFSIATRTRLDIVSGNFAAGFFLVLIVLFLFLDPAIALWTALGIPIAIAIATIFMPSLDVSINSVSLCGVILVLGMIVDDAIIISESIYREMEGGSPPREAAFNGLKTVIKPVFGTIITSIIAFIPLYFLPGVIGDFAQEVPTVVNVMLAASFLEACLILPSHLGHRKKAPSVKSTPPGTRLIRYLEVYYARFLEKAFQHKYTTVLLTLSLLVIGISIGIKNSRFKMFDLAQASRIYFMAEVKEGSPLSYTESQAKVLEEIVDQLPYKDSIVSFKTTVGLEGSFKGTRFPASTSLLSELVLPPFTERSFTASDVALAVKEAIHNHPKINFRKFDFEIDAEGPNVGRPVELQIIADDTKTRVAVIQNLMAGFKRLNLPLEEVNSDNQPGKEELVLKPDFAKLSAAGVNAQQIAQTLRTGFAGTIVADLKTTTENTEFRLMIDENQHHFEDPLKDLLVRNQYGNLLALKGLMKEETRISQKKLLHYNGHPSNLITANVKPGSTVSQLYTDLEALVESTEAKYPSAQILIGGEAKESQSFMIEIGLLISMAVLGIYLWLVFQLDSMTQPLMVVLAIPFGIVGILGSFIAHGYALSLLAMVGLVGVGGVLVNDSLIMVEFINRLRRDKTTDLQTAIIQGARHRFRPVILTTVTTVIGLLPTAYGLIGGTDSFVSPLVFAMTWGLLIGTPSVLIVIPVLYATIIGLKDSKGTR